MKARIIFLFIVIMSLFLASSCRKSELFDPADPDGLYLKAANPGEIAVIHYFDSKTGKVLDFQYPANKLFKVEGNDATIINEPLLKVKSFNVFNNGEADFLIAEFDAQPLPIGSAAGQTLYSPTAENVQAIKLPFTADDYGVPGEALQRFNGIIKAGQYVFAIKDGQVKAYDLTARKILYAKSAVKFDALSIQLDNSLLVLSFMQTSPAGNIFKLSWSGGSSSGYALSD